MSFDPRLLRDALAAFERTVGSRLDACCVAFSGGLDSTVLLGAMAELRDRGALSGVGLRALHVDHSLHADSGRWADACAFAARQFGVAYESLRVDAAAGRGESPEAAARGARYAALAAAQRAGEWLLTAQHADDQLETVLLQLLRGGGLRAAAGMPPIAPFGAGWHARPLLGVPRADLEQWALARGLRWLDDPSNRDLRFDRNHLRHEVLPRIRARWPGAARAVGRVAVQAGEAVEILAGLTAADLAGAMRGGALALEPLAALPAARWRLAVVAWLRRQGRSVPSAAVLAALEHSSRRAAADRVPCVSWPGMRVYRYRGHLVAEGGTWPALSADRVQWATQDPLALGAAQSLELRPAVGAGLSRARIPPVLTVSQRRGGETFRSGDGRHRRELRKWLQERGVLPWWRDRIPLLWAADELVAVGDLGCAGPCAAAPDEPSWRVVWHGRPALTLGEVTGPGGAAGRAAGTEAHGMRNAE